MLSIHGKDSIYFFSFCDLSVYTLFISFFPGNEKVYIFDVLCVSIVKTSCFALEVT